MQAYHRCLYILYGTAVHNIIFLGCLTKDCPRVCVKCWECDQHIKSLLLPSHWSTLTEWQRGQVPREGRHLSVVSSNVSVYMSFADALGLYGSCESNK